MNKTPLFNGIMGSTARQFKKHATGMVGLFFVTLFVLAGIYAPLLASSKPLVVNWNGQWFFPLFRYLFYQGFYTKRIDLFFNLLMFTFPLTVVGLAWGWKKERRLTPILLGGSLVQGISFLYLIFFPVSDPAFDPTLSNERQKALQQCAIKGCISSWNFDLSYMTPYAQLNAILSYDLKKKQDIILQSAVREAWDRDRKKKIFPSLWEQSQHQEAIERERQTMKLLQIGAEGGEGSVPYFIAQGRLRYRQEKKEWLERESEQIRMIIMPLIRWAHWEDDAGGDQALNQSLPWWELTRINRKDLVSALIFGVRISLMVGFLAVGLSLLIGVPIGAFAGYWGGKIDIATCRLLEIWESMPTFFMLLMVVAMTQTKSIFIVISVVGLFGWTTFSRYIRGEFLKQRNLPYVESCKSLGYSNFYIIFYHILPNAIPPLLTLLPFAVMAAITSEAGLSFLGLGEEGSCSWGVLMDEGRTAFPGESYLLWPPAILLTVLLIAIALVGDTLRDVLDPKMHR